MAFISGVGQLYVWYCCRVSRVYELLHNFPSLQIRRVFIRKRRLRQRVERQRLVWFLPNR